MKHAAIVYACVCLWTSMLVGGCNGEATAPPPVAQLPVSPIAIRSASTFCEEPGESLHWLVDADFCAEFGSGTDPRWISPGGLWDVVDNEYVGAGVQEACGTGFATNASLVRDLQSQDVEMRVDMRSLTRVDKGIVLRSTGPGDQIELNFRADPYNDLIVQELLGCQFVLLETAAHIPHELGQTIVVHAKLVGDRLVVRIDGELVVDQRYTFRATSGSVGLAVIEDGATAFDNVQVRVDAVCR